MTDNLGKNKGGRPKGSVNESTRKLKELAGRHTKDAIDCLVKIMKKSKNEQNRMLAAEQILNRAHGKPAQAIVGDENNGPVNLLIRWEK